MRYTYNLMEEYVKKMYNTIGIYLPHQLDMESIAARLGTTLIYLPYGSMTVGNAILIDIRLSPTAQWQEFGHELCHVEWHDGNQRVLPSSFLEYQEWKASNFAYHACVPTFMLDRMNLPSSEVKAIFVVQETFNVDYEFAKKRLNQYLSNTYHYSQSM
ncbi:ImmA/IrrE family metallo-endopeptidase [Psychrobacillus sp. Sa2BUA9]|uniref:ImmA/IrrE family metallo-endopeptidase n=1 Tax=Psychrobacillus faecigallinarum TaxID=2762235 RepID=A0ABR8RAD1_9BACI|nr:ImmA/IrrE family metallo-endopeptidase [Psychrobacillus faecigallinarum]MBD7944753.1 ImmA/IrrE family metallo-endopeptidase [Psychrobacillus faecigallinarum]